ncbi:hypothetical protein RDWZM_008337 [Blomia tropicalis]|uniref:Uncharacterized protein n=1 Tax=Blomia tropicalis TaxID=40697 RepID=A0A9Q0RK92_BLOTA|nr:hypothetical protein RDWZM_008337 [Blomia tropicalis]
MTGDYRTFIDELYNKYCEDEPLEELELKPNDTHNRVYQYVGFDKLMSKLKMVCNLPNIILANRNIGSCGNVDFQKFTLLKVYSLDLSLNQITNWKSILEIISLTKCLREINLSGNPLLPPTNEEIEMIGNKFNNIRILVLGNLTYSWEDVCKCAILMPHIENINLIKNAITKITNADIYENLKSLCLMKNPISSWDEICKLGKLSKLEKLEVNSCSIKSISFGNNVENTDKCDLFPALNFLDLSGNLINDWKSIAQLNRLRNLSDLRMHHIPLYDTNQYGSIFNCIISRISGLQKLNQELITKEKRIDGEKYYLRIIYPEFLQQNDSVSREKFFEENPCFQNLLKKYGEPIIAKQLTKEDKIKQNFLNLKICDKENDEECKRLIQKQFPISIKVSNLKFILRRLLKIGIEQDFQLAIESKDYNEIMDDRYDVNKYRIDLDHIIYVQRL